MAKKQKMLASDGDTQLANAVRDSAQQIWQAGLGAFAKAQEDGSRKLEQVFDERVARALGALGVPTPEQWQALNARVEQMSKALEALSGQKLAEAETLPEAPPEGKVKAKAKAKAKPKAKNKTKGGGG